MYDAKVMKATRRWCETNDYEWISCYYDSDTAPWAVFCHPDYDTVIIACITYSFGHSEELQNLTYPRSWIEEEVLIPVIDLLDDEHLDAKIEFAHLHFTLGKNANRAMLRIEWNANIFEGE